jgi:hypothetical protein
LPPGLSTRSECWLAKAASNSKVEAADDILLARLTGVVDAAHRATGVPGEAS